MRRLVVARWGAGVVLCLGAVGCSDRPATVSGTVTFAGQPLPAGTIVLYGPDKKIARGVVGRDGRYTVPDAPRGACAVAVLSQGRLPAGFQIKQQLPPSTGAPRPPVADPGGAPLVVLPVRYALPEESKLSVLVDRDAVTFDIELTP